MRIILVVFSFVFGIDLIRIVIDYEQGKELKGLEGREINPHAMFVAEVLAVITAILVPIGAIVGVVNH